MVTSSTRARAVAVAPLLVAAGFGAYALATLPLGTPTRPGPGLWPVVVSVAVVALSLLAMLSGHAGEGATPFTPRVRQVAAAVAVTAVFVWAFTWFGLVLPALAFLIVWLRWFGRESWRTTLMVAVLTTIAFYVLFVTLLAVPLPLDVLSPILPR
jgi:putative tricarboxylic transport membrane protein